ncbi:MAG: zinc metallopeptidase [Chloroflexi bacterium RBG_16_57_11]|nr:MAG: zinc metallopeptidase [Chloroflexi bacterium RBG_16_57_11]
MIFYTNYWIYMMPAFILMMLVQFYVRSAYSRWSRVPARSRFTGAEAAQRLIQSAGLYDVRIEGIKGELTDHYDPRSKVLRLSSGVYDQSSVAALAIAAHELGHAMQDKDGYFPLRLRAALVPAVNIGSYLGWILLMIGFFLQLTGIAWLGVVVFSGGAIFALATLPVELNASARARRLLSESGLVVSDEEMKGVSNVLNAAALTYVAALITAVLQMIYWVSLVLGMGGRRRS